jgi:catechol 2,3-dioxygenase-like lactoylglutathione lyase family enzyme
MLTRIDHVMICVPDLARARDTYARLGFDVQPGGIHPGRGTENAITFFEHDYLELLGLRDREEYLAASPDGGLVEFLAAGGGLRYIAVQSDDLDADVAAMRARGVDVGAIADGARRTPAGQQLTWRSARLGPRNPLPLFFIQHVTPLAERRGQGGAQPNGVRGVDRVYVAVPDVTKAAETYARVLGIPVPPVQRGRVIKADMVVFDVGPTGVTVAQPAEPGPAADALARRGPGPFQVLYRTRSLDDVERAMAERGAPVPPREIRNTGEQVIVVTPERACGVNIGLVGPK